MVSRKNATSVSDRFSPSCRPTALSSSGVGSFALAMRSLRLRALLIWKVPPSPSQAHPPRTPRRCIGGWTLTARPPQRQPTAATATRLDDIIVISEEGDRVAQVVIRNIEEDAMRRLKSRAARKGVSLERELRTILTDAARADRSGFGQRAAAFRRKLVGRRHSDSTRLIRKERDR